MLKNCIYKPADNEIIYLYCDVESFHSICTTKKLRFTDLFSMNDFLELHWGYSIWLIVANMLLPKFGREFIDKVDECVSGNTKLGLMVASCFSLDGDVLSQWRAYSNDGTGFAIGFSAKQLLNLPVTPLKVIYDKEQQISELKNAIMHLHEIEEKKGEKYNDDFKINCYVLASDLASFKNPAFNEEKEVRLIHLLDFTSSNNFLKLTDAGGNYFGKEVEGEKVLHRIKNNVLTAYIEENFTNNGEINPIKEVIIGPKNPIRKSAVAIYLETEGIGSVNIKQSEASYR